MYKIRTNNYMGYLESILGGSESLPALLDAVGEFYEKRKETLSMLVGDDSSTATYALPVRIMQEDGTLLDTVVAVTHSDVAEAFEADEGTTFSYHNTSGRIVELTCDELITALEVAAEDAGAQAVLYRQLAKYGLGVEFNTTEFITLVQAANGFIGETAANIISIAKTVRTAGSVLTTEVLSALQADPVDANDLEWNPEDYEDAGNPILAGCIQVGQDIASIFTKAFEGCNTIGSFFKAIGSAIGDLFTMILKKVNAQIMCDYEVNEKLENTNGAIDIPVVSLSFGGTLEECWNLLLESIGSRVAFGIDASVTSEEGSHPKSEVFLPLKNKLIERGFFEMYLPSGMLRLFYNEEGSRLNIGIYPTLYTIEWEGPNERIQGNPFVTKWLWSELDNFDVTGYNPIAVPYSVGTGSNQEFLFGSEADQLASTLWSRGQGAYKAYQRAQEATVSWGALLPIYNEEAVGLDPVRGSTVSPMSSILQESALMHNVNVDFSDWESFSPAELIDHMLYPANHYVGITYALTPGRGLSLAISPWLWAAAFTFAESRQKFCEWNSRKLGAITGVFGAGDLTSTAEVFSPYLTNPSEKWAAHCQTTAEITREAGNLMWMCIGAVIGAVAAVTLKVVKKKMKFKALKKQREAASKWTDFCKHPGDKSKAKAYLKAKKQSDRWSRLSGLTAPVAAAAGSSGSGSDGNQFDSVTDTITKLVTSLVIGSDD